MLLGEDAGGKRFDRVVVANGDGGLQDDGAGVESLVHEMHGASREFRAVLEGLALGFESRKRGQERRMNIQDASAKSLHKIGREQSHVAGEADEIDSFLLQRGDDLAVIGFAFEALGWNDASVDAARAGAFDAGSAFAMADDDGNLSVGNAAGGDTICKGFEIRAATRQ